MPVMLRLVPMRRWQCRAPVRSQILVLMALRLIPLRQRQRQCRVPVRSQTLVLMAPRWIPLLRWPCRAPMRWLT